MEGRRGERRGRMEWSGVEGTGGERKGGERRETEREPPCKNMVRRPPSGILVVGSH
jgi:hypothetical protein